MSSIYHVCELVGKGLKEGELRRKLVRESEYLAIGAGNGIDCANQTLGIDQSRNHNRDALCFP
jgi:hypothetical protein